MLHGKPDSVFFEIFCDEVRRGFCIVIGPTHVSIPGLIAFAVGFCYIKFKCSKKNKAEGVCRRCDSAAVQMKREAGVSPARSRHRDPGVLLHYHWSNPGREEGRGFARPVSRETCLSLYMGKTGSRGIDCTKVRSMGNHACPRLQCGVSFLSVSTLALPEM